MTQIFVVLTGGLPYALPNAPLSPSPTQNAPAPVRGVAKGRARQEIVNIDAGCWFPSRPRML